MRVGVVGTGMVGGALATKLADLGHDVFLCGDDAAAKGTVVDLLHAFGWRDPIDLGGINGARGTEAIMPLWLRLWNAVGSADFNFKIQTAGRS